MHALFGGTRRYRGKAAAVLCNFCRLQRCTVVSLPGPPIASSEPRRYQAYGCEWVDPFSWMEGDEKRLRLHLSKEQSWHDRAVRATQLVGRRPEALMDNWQSAAAQGPVDSFKEPIGKYHYFIRHSEEQESPHYMRCPTANRGTEQSVLDINALAANGPISVGTMKLSDEHEQLAYTLSTNGGASTAFIKEIATGKILGSIQGVHGIEWLADTRTLLYTTANALLRPSRVWKHVLQRPQTADELLFEEGRPDCFVTLTKTKDGSFVVINSTSKISSEARLLDASNASSNPILVQERQSDLEYFVEHHAGRLLILSSDGVTDNRLFSASLAEPGRLHWEVILPDRPGIVIEDLSVFRGCVVLWERHGGLPGFSILPLDAARVEAEPDGVPCQGGSETLQTASDAQHNILRILGSKAATLEGARRESRDFEDLRRITPGTLQRVDSAGCGSLGLRSFVFKPEGGVTAVSPGSDADFGAGYFSMDASSPVQAQQTLFVPLAIEDENEGVAYEGRSQEREASAEMLQCWQAFATSADGTKIPMTLARDTRQPLQDGSRQPCLFQVYGAYGMKMEAEYCPATFDLLKRGWTLAFAHVRGGGELGRRWHHAGRQLGKLKAIQDAHACLDYLIQEGLATDGSIVLKAGSAGGIIAGALLVSRPATFGAAALRMPFLDLLTAALEPDMALTEHEWDEWGDPRDPGGVELLRKLCPYLGLSRLSTHGARFPPTLVTAAKDDDRVPIWMPAKWVAALRQRLGPQCPVFLNVIEGGHHLAEADERTLQSAEIAFLSGGLTAISMSTC